MSEVEFRDRCSQPALSHFVSPYCFGDLSEQERDAFELHLITCEGCWEEVQRLAAAVRVLRTDGGLKQTLITPELFGMFGLSGALSRSFGGHSAFALVSAILYGLLHAASAWTELAYSYDRFGMLAWTLSPSLLLIMAAVLMCGFSIAHRQVMASKDKGLIWSVGIVVSSAVLLIAVMFAVLPSEQTIEATFETRTASGGFQKNVTYYFLPLLIFLLPTFHTILAMQRELSLGRHQRVLDLILGTADAVTPRGVWLIRPWILWLMFAVGVVIGLQGTNRMLDNLTPGPYANIFTAALHVRVALWFVIAGLSVAWYQRSLNEIKREALAALRVTSSGPKH